MGWVVRVAWRVVQDGGWAWRVERVRSECEVGSDD